MTWSKDEKSGRARRARDRSNTRRPDQSGTPEKGSAWEESKHKADKRRKRNRVGRLVIGIALILVVGVALLPTVASWFAPGIIASSASGAIAGRVEVDSVSLSWFGSQKVEKLRLYDDQGEQRAELGAIAEKGLLGLAVAGGDYGTIRLSGWADLSPDQQGRQITEHTVGSPSKPQGSTPPPASGPLRLPALNAKIILENLRVTYADPSLGDGLDAVQIDGISGTINASTANEARAKIDAVIGTRRAGQTIFASAGAIGIEALITNLVDGSGIIQTENANIEAGLTLDRLAPSLLRLVPGLKGDPEAALGSPMTVALIANGTGDNLAVNLSASAEAFEAIAPLRVSVGDALVTADAPITARLDLDSLSALIPNRDELLGPGAEVHITDYPRLNVEITGLHAPIPQEAGLDLSGAGAVVNINIGELNATVAEPGTGTARTATLLPGSITLDASDLASPVRLTADLGTRIDGSDSGSLTADLTAENLLDDNGAPNTGSTPSIRGSLRAQQIALAAAQPIAAAAGIDLVSLLGDTADLEITARPLGSHTEPSTMLILKGSAEHASIDGRLSLSGSTIQSDGITISLDRLDPLLAETLAPSGISLTEAGGAELRVRRLAMGLDQVARGDLSGISLAATTKLTRFAATLDESGDTIETTVLNAEAIAEPLSEGVRITSNARLRMNDRLAGVIAADLSASGLLDESGAAMGGLPTKLSGTVNATQVRTAALQPFAGSDLLKLPQDIGPTIDLVLTAQTSSPSSSTGTIPPTDLALDITSEKLNGRGTFTLSPDRITTKGEGLTMTLAQVGSILERSGSLGESVSLHKPGWVRLTVPSLDLPLVQGKPIPEKASANTELRIAGITIASGSEAATFDHVAAGVTLTPDKAPLLTLDGATTSGNKKGTIEGRIELRNAFAPIDDDGTLLARPSGTLDLRDIPTSIAGLMGITLPVDGGGTLALSDLASAATGPDIDLKLTLTEASADRGLNGISVATEISSARTNLTADASVQPGPGGAMNLVALNAEGSVKLTQYLARTLAKAGAPKQYHTIRLPEPGEIVLTATTDSQGTVALQTGLARTTIAGLPVPDGEGGYQTLDPIALSGKADADLPLAILRGDPNPQPVRVEARLDGFALDQPDTRALTLRASASTTLVEMTPSGKTSAMVRVATQRTEWLDALAGLDGMLAEAVGRNLRLDANLEAQASPDGSMGEGDASIEIASPLLKTASPIELAIAPDSVTLERPAEIRWTLTKKLTETLAPNDDASAGQIAIARDIPITMRADQLELPLGGAPTKTRAIASLTADALPLVFPDGSEHRYRDLSATLRTMPNADAAKLVVKAADPSAPDTDALGLDATVVGLPDGSDDWSAQQLALTGNADLRAFPVRLIDAMGSGDGTLVELLGQTLRLDADITRFPRRGGTFVLDARTEQASTGIKASVQNHPRYPGRLASVLDEPMRTQLTHFEYEIQNKSVPLLPMFARVEKVQGEHQPASVVIESLVAPVDGDPALVIMKGRVDPGVVDFDLDQGLEALLKIAGQRDAGVAGDRLEPFAIAMDKGVASFSDVAVPFGEFVFQAEGAIDIVRGTEDIMLYIPAGAFAAEALGSAGALLESVTIPVRRQGPLDQKNQWKPDFSKAFKPENIIKDQLENRIKDILPGGLDDILPGGG